MPGHVALAASPLTCYMLIVTAWASSVVVARLLAMAKPLANLLLRLEEKLKSRAGANVVSGPTTSRTSTLTGYIPSRKTRAGQLGVAELVAIATTAI